MVSAALRVVIGLGANIGRPQPQMELAVRALAQLGTVEAVSGLYKSAAVGGPPQPDYLNAALLLRTDWRLNDLLGALLSIERTAGRERRERWGPRPLDLDILWADGVQLKSAELEVPHPRLLERAFAILPLIELVPDAADPRSGAVFADSLLPGLALQDCQRVAGWVAGLWGPESSAKSRLLADQLSGEFA